MLRERGSLSWEQVQCVSFYLVSGASMTGSLRSLTKLSWLGDFLVMGALAVLRCGLIDLPVPSGGGWSINKCGRIG